MKRRTAAVLLSMVIFLLLPLQAEAATLLVPVGKIIGLQLRDNAMTVVGYDDILGENARQAGLKIGDEIVKIGGVPITDSQDIYAALEQGSATLDVSVRRGHQETVLHLTPVQTDQGPRLGVYLRQGIAGMGTVTFYDPETHCFGTLGHGVSDSGGNLMKMTGGEIFDAQVVDVKKGKNGEAGQLRGSADSCESCGTLIRNTPQGVFGISPRGWEGEAVEVGEYADVHTGSASILSTVQGDEVQSYCVEIVKIYPEDRTDGRNFLIRVTDPTLIQATGGIVQGMSGSPIVQDGKLIGAVTHVLVSDPTAGYGIYIENMLKAAA